MENVVFFVIELVCINYENVFYIYMQINYYFNVDENKIFGNGVRV